MLQRLGLSAFALLHVLAYGATTAAPQVPCAVQPINAQWTTTAQFIAGLKVVPGIPADNEKAWDKFSSVSNADWRNLEKRYLSRIDAWRGHALAGTASQQIGFYPFGGP